MLTRSLAQELPSGLGTVAFNPRVINTDMLRAAYGEQAFGYDSPEEWTKYEVDKLEGFTLSDFGKTLIG